MTDLQALLAVCADVEQSLEEAVLASVVKVEGSAYRRPGARMLIAALGKTEGTISGGCLESAVAQKAWWLTERGRPVLQRYSSAAGEDEEDGLFGLGCNGTLHLLLERHSQHRPAPVIGLLREIVRQGQSGAIARVIACPAQGAIGLGQYLLCEPGDVWRSDLLDEGLRAALTASLQQTLRDGRSSSQRYAAAAGEVEVFCEFIAAPRRLLIFGAGYDAQPLVEMAKLTGWHVTVIDSRPHFARPGRFARADSVRCIGLESPLDWATLANGAAALVMSHSYRQDRYWLNALLRCRPCYIGQLGPRSRTERLLAELLDSQSEQPGLEVLHYPMGLDLGADTPQDVALAALAEITAVVNGRQGGQLRHRSGTIHGRNDDPGVLLDVDYPAVLHPRV